MGEPDSPTLTRRAISDAVSDNGWRYVLGELRSHVPVASLAEAIAVAGAAVAACGDDADGHLRADLRADVVLLSLQARGTGQTSRRDIDLAGRVAQAVVERGWRIDADVGAGERRSSQVLELAVDALDIAAVRPFWKAVMGYADEAPGAGPEDPLVDPLGQGPAIWFQRMDAPRPQRNRIHVDVSVPHDEARRRIDATLAAGGRIAYDAEAPAFWVLADPEGNEACVTTWQGRDP